MEMLDEAGTRTEITTRAPNPDDEFLAKQAAKKIDAEAREQLTLLIDELRLFSQSTDEVSLERQAKILESSFAVLMRKYMTPGNAYESYFRLALQAQSQCLDALKAKTIVRYMESLINPRTVVKILESPPPTPRNGRSETE